MAKTFKEGTEDVSRQKERETPDSTSPGPSDFQDISARTFELIAKAASIDNPSVDVPERRGEERLDFQDEFQEALEEVLSGDLESIQETIDDIDDINLGELPEGELLRVMAEILKTMMDISNARMQNDVVIASFLEDIASSVEEGFGFSVSGFNSASSRGVPEPVIEGGVSVPTKVLKVRASPTNAQPVYIGGGSVSVEGGFELRPGESIDLPLNTQDFTPHFVSDDSNAEVSVLGVV